MTISDILDSISSGTSVIQVVTDALARAKDSNEHNVFISLSEERALERAKVIDARIAAGENCGRLAGVPFAIKDNFLTIGDTTTAASNFLKDFKSPIQATAVEKLEAEGAVCIGKVNLDAFAHGGSTENSAFGVTKNAKDDTRVAGGSSGGSAVAVALDIVPFALGTDTGGSIRQPASFNGVVGYKPTYGMVSRFGVVAMASGTDTIGVLAANTGDTALVMDIMAGLDVKDMTTLPDYFSVQSSNRERKKIGLIKEFMSEGIDEDVKTSILQTAEALKSAGYEVEEVSLPIVRHALAMYYVIVPAEISSNLARYDGIRYGSRSKDAKTLGDVFEMSRQEGFMSENKRRIIIGSYVLSSGYFDAYYQKAQKARTLLIKDFEGLFEEYDALIGPVSPTVAFKVGEKTSDPLTMYLADTMTVPPSLAGLPAISIPVVETDGMPVGLQIIAKAQDDAYLLSLATDIEGVVHG
jgi:aspartyl-tRNA(Asn)/glutamyl-tRNA(Gln) amidotransferase subunit A